MEQQHQHRIDAEDPDRHRDAEALEQFGHALQFALLHLRARQPAKTSAGAAPWPRAAPRRSRVRSASTLSVTLRERSKRSICDGPLPITISATEPRSTLPPLPLTRSCAMASRLPRTDGSMRTRIAIWRSGRLSLGSEVE